MKDCPVCLKPVRLGASRIRVNRKQGVFHYIAHTDDSPFCLPRIDWSTVMLKPYPKNEADKPRVHMVQRWEALPRAGTVQALSGSAVSPSVSAAQK